jgi:phosphate starvation-inducible membrane PsiE
MPAAAGLIAFAFAFIAPLFVLDWNADGLRPAPGNHPRQVAHLWLAVVAAEGVVFLMGGAWTLWRIATLVKGVANPGAVLARTVALPLFGGLLFVLLLVHLCSGTGFPPVAIGDIPVPNLALFRIVGLFVAGMACGGLVLTWYVHRPETAQPAMEALSKARRSQAILSEFLFAASVNLAFAVLSASALRNAVNAAKKDTFSSEFVIAYGAIHSILILAVYLPVRISLSSEVELVLRDLLPPPSGPGAISEWSKQRAELDEYLGLTAKSLYGAGGLLATTLPLLTGWITQLLK